MGRPSKDAKVNALEKQIAYQDAVDRNPMEGKFGEGKRKYGLGRIFARLQETSETVISLQFLVMNLEKVLRETFLFIFQTWMRQLISQNEKHVIIVTPKIRVVQ